MLGDLCVRVCREVTPEEARRERQASTRPLVDCMWSGNKKESISTKVYVFEEVRAELLFSS